MLRPGTKRPHHLDDSCFTNLRDGATIFLLATMYPSSMYHLHHTTSAINSGLDATIRPASALVRVTASGQLLPIQMESTVLQKPAEKEPPGRTTSVAKYNNFPRVPVLLNLCRPSVRWACRQSPNNIINVALRW